MPLSYTRRFRVRYVECDADEFVRDAVYFRYLQETAFDASAAGGYDQARYLAMRRIWLIRETHLWFSGRLRFGDTAQITSWVDDFQRVRSRRAYALRHAASNRVLVQGYSDWAFLDLDTGRPALIPEELTAAFFPEGVPERSAVRDRFPALVTPSSQGLTVRRQVEWRDLDGAGHVNNAVYLDYLEEATRQLLARHGWTHARMAGAGFGLAPQEHRIEYRLPALPDDELEVTVWLAEIGPGSALRYGTVARAGDDGLLAQALLRLGAADLAHGEPVAFPPDMVVDLAPAA